jgi:hypothetical protein
MGPRISALTLQNTDRPFAVCGKCWMLATWISMKISSIDMTMSGIQDKPSQMSNKNALLLSAVQGATLRLHEVNVLKWRAVVWDPPAWTCARKSPCDMRGLKTMKSWEIGWLPASSSLPVRLSCLWTGWICKSETRTMHLDLAEGNNVKKLMKMLKIPS